MNRRRASALLAAFAAVVAVLVAVPAASPSSLANVELKVKITGQGSVTGPGIDCHTGNTGTCTNTYTEDSTENFTATADSGWVFSDWDGECERTTPVCDVYFGSDASLTANFKQSSPSTHTVTVSVTGSGKVTGPGIDCGSGGSACAASFTAGTQVTLTATPGSGATFGAWGGACSATGLTCTLTVDGPKAVTAAFSAGTSTSTLTVSATGSGTVTGQGISCGNGAGDCSETYSAGTSVTLTETPASGATFSGWGGSCSGTTTTCTVSLTTSLTVTASFSTGPAAQSTLTVTATGSGRVTGPGISCGLGSTDCSEIYTANSSVTLIETPASGAAFAGWGGSCAGTASSCTVVMNVSKSVTAGFTQGSAQQILTVTVGGAGRVSGPGISCGTSVHDCSQAFDKGQTATLLATPSAGAVFLGWGGACSGTGQTCTLVMNTANAVSASFSTLGTTTGATFAARSLGSPLVVRDSVGWDVTLHFFTSRSATARLRLSLNGRLVTAFTFSPRAGTVLVGPFNAARAGLYTFRLTLSDSRGATADLRWNLCLPSPSCGAFRPVAFFRSLGATAVRTATGWLIRARFQAASTGTATVRVFRAGRQVSAGSFAFRRGAVTVDLPAGQAGLHKVVLTARSAAGRTVQIRWNVLLS